MDLQFPLPDWAVRHNTQAELIPGTQLCTRDGRRCGNARILDRYKDHHGEHFQCMTDIGTLMVLSPGEIHELFWIGPYILKEGE